jgi:hypothetical protein
MKFKRGDTFYFAGLLPVALAAGNWSAACVLEAEDGTKFPVTATLTPPVAPETKHTLALSQTAALTATWPVGKMKGDVQFTDAGQVPAFVFSSRDFEFDVIADRT